jgi:DNA sulfur modification protein DndE
MKPPVETVRISKQGREILLRIKRRTGLERWNDICRAAMCRSLNNDSKPPIPKKLWDTAIEIDWKTFAGGMSDDLIAVLKMRAITDDFDHSDENSMARYFRAHIERGISSLQNVKSLSMYIELISKPEN